MAQTTVTVPTAVNYRDPNRLQKQSQFSRNQPQVNALTSGE